MLSPRLRVSPFAVTGGPWSGLVLVTPLPRVDCPVLVSVTPDLVWFALALPELAVLVTLPP